jgi:hypothetical protein
VPTPAPIPKATAMAGSTLMRGHPSEGTQIRQPVG